MVLTQANGSLDRCSRETGSGETQLETAIFIRALGQRCGGFPNSRFHTLLFGINKLCSDEMPHFSAKGPSLGAFVQLLCNRYFALNTQKMITITKALRPACSTLLHEKCVFRPSGFLPSCPGAIAKPLVTMRQPKIGILVGIV